VQKRIFALPAAIVFLLISVANLNSQQVEASHPPFLIEQHVPASAGYRLFENADNSCQVVFWRNGAIIGSAVEWRRVRGYRVLIRGRVALRQNPSGQLQIVPQRRILFPLPIVPESIFQHHCMDRVPQRDRVIPIPLQPPTQAPKAVPCPKKQ